MRGASYAAMAAKPDNAQGIRYWSVRWSFFWGDWTPSLQDHGKSFQTHIRLDRTTLFPDFGFPKGPILRKAKLLATTSCFMSQLGWGMQHARDKTLPPYLIAVWSFSLAIRSKLLPGSLKQDSCPYYRNPVLRGEHADGWTWAFYNWLGDDMPACSVACESRQTTVQTQQYKNKKMSELPMCVRTLSDLPTHRGKKIRDNYVTSSIFELCLSPPPDFEARQNYAGKS